MQWFRIETEGNAIGIYPTPAYRAVSTVIRFFTGALGGGVFAVFFYGIDYVGRTQAGVQPGLGFWPSVAITVGFFATAYALIGSLRFHYLVVDKRQVTMGKRWVFGPPTTVDIPSEDIDTIAVQNRALWIPSTIEVTISDSKAAVFSSWFGTDELEACAAKAKDILEID